MSPIFSFASLYTSTPASLLTVGFLLIVSIYVQVAMLFGVYTTELFPTEVRLRGNGVAWVDAPVSGGAVGAKAGTLSVFLGGDDADIARVTPWLAAYARNVTHMGGVGNGEAAKSCNQAVVAASIALWAEVIAYARRAGLDPDLLVDALAGGWADSEIRRVHGHDLVAGRFRRTPTFIMLKDLDIIDDVARANKAPMPLPTYTPTLPASSAAMSRPACSTSP